MLADQYLYSPFGVEEPLSASGNPFRYTGRYYDGETGLYYYRSRYYNTGGRFLEPDSILYDGGLNLYSYGGGDPINNVDPLGECGRPPNVLAPCANFLRGIADVPVAHFAILQQARGLNRGDRRALSVNVALKIAGGIAAGDILESGELGLNTAKNNPARFSGRVVAQSAVGFYGARLARGAALKKTGSKLVGGTAALGFGG